MKDNCYKGEKTELGIHKDFYMDLLSNKSRGSFSKSYLLIDRPTNYAEAELLVEFIYGIKLKVEIEHFTNKLKSANWGFNGKETQREIALAKLNDEDSLYRADSWHADRLVKRDIAHFRWYIGRQTNHDDYSDYQFNKTTLDASYEIEATVLPQTIFGLRGSGGIGYGDTTITSFKELERIESFYLNRDAPARPEYIEYIARLVKKNKTYRYNDLKNKIKHFEI